MKKTTLFNRILMLFVCLTFATLVAYGQKVTLNYQNAPFDRVLNAIKKQTGLSLVYSEQLVDVNRRVTIKVKQVELRSALKQLLSGTNLDFEISNQKLYLVKKTVSQNNVSAISTTEHKRKIKGKITDYKTGEPIIGATVTEKGNVSNRTITDVNGNFDITATTNSIFVVNSLGYSSTEVTAKGNSNLNIILQEDSKIMDEVVVIGYGESTRKDLTGAISSIKGDEIAKSNSIDFAQAIQGKVAGLQITSQSGEAGAGVDMKIRGTNSINAGTYPLYVIDGMQIDVNEGEVSTSNVGNNMTYNPLATINPNDIESIDVLKDASATAIFGSRAANGVIIITTKKGSSVPGTYNVELNTSLGISTVARKLKMLTPQEFIDYQFSRNLYRETYGKDTDGDGVADIPVNAGDYNTFDWQELMLRTGMTKNVDLTLTGTSKGGTAISSALGYLTQKGLVINNDFKRYSGRIKFDNKINEKFSVGVSATFGQTVSDGAISSGGGEGSYNGVIQGIYLERPIELYSPSEAAGEYQDGWLPLTTLVTSETYKKQTMTRLFANLYANYQITKDLALKLRASKNMSFSKMSEFYSSHSKWGRTDRGRASVRQNETESYNASIQAEYYKRFLNKHSVRFMMGGELSSYHSERTYTKTTQFADETTGVFDLSKGELPTIPSSNVYETSRMSMFSRLLYNYMYKYYATLSFRADASSYFQPGNRVGYFPSLALSWRVNEEKFLKKVKFINNMKLRASMGANGNDRITTFSSSPTIAPNYYASEGVKLLGMSPLNYGNPDLKWETTYQYNVGIDLDLFDSRISLVADAYYKDTRDMLLKALIPSQSGFTSQWRNLGRVMNKGLEVALITRNIESPTFSWSTNLNFDMNRNKVRSLGDIQFLPVSISSSFFNSDQGRIIVGEPIGTGYGYVFDGVYQIKDFVWTDKHTGAVIDPSSINSSNIDAYNYKLADGVVSINSQAVQPGHRKYKDLSGPDGKPDGTITVDDKTVISNSNPKFNFGFGNQFRYKNFELSIFFTGSYGGEVINEFKRLTEGGSPSQYNLTQEYWHNHWTPENPSNTYSSITNENGYVSSYYVEDVSYIRLKDINLSYTVDKALVQRLKLRNAIFYLSASNVYVWSDYSGLDPEVRSPQPSLRGYDRLSYPRARTFTFGLKLTF